MCVLYQGGCRTGAVTRFFLGKSKFMCRNSAGKKLRFSPSSTQLYSTLSPSFILDMYSTYATHILGALSRILVGIRVCEAGIFHSSKRSHFSAFHGVYNFQTKHDTFPPPSLTTGGSHLHINILCSFTPPPSPPVSLPRDLR